MIKYMETVRREDGGIVATLFADTKTEVPSTGAETTTETTNFVETLKPGSLVYTADGNAALLKSDDNWAWQGSGGSTNPVFTLHFSDDTTQDFEYTDGMTWAEYVESDFNSQGLFAGEDYIEYDYHRIRFHDDSVEMTEHISSSENYTVDLNE